MVKVFDADRKLARVLWKRRVKRARAFRLSLLFPGLGQVYQGRLSAGVAFSVIGLFPLYYLYLVGKGLNYGTVTLLAAQGLLYGLQALDAKRGASRETSPCEDRCPASVAVPAFLSFAQEGKIHESYAAFCVKSPFPYILGRLCPAPCESVCGVLPGRPLKIKELHRRVGERLLSEVEVVKRSPFFPPAGRKVAVIGGGLAGITAAYYLASIGVEVEIFEKEEQLGGLLNYIPDFKLDFELARKELKLFTSFENIKVHLGVEVRSLPENFDAYVVAVGAQVEKSFNPAGYTGSFLTPLKFLREPPKLKGKRVAVVGAGDTAFDVARLARRLGAEVDVLYRGRRESVKAQEAEVRAAISEGVNLYTGCEFKGAEGKRLIFSCGSSDYDYLVPAVGFEVDRELIGGLSSENSFITGDAATGMTTFIEAVSRARQTAVAVARKLGLGLRCWFDEDFYREKPKGAKSCGFICSEASLCEHCGQSVRS
ncbi:FAD-dependent pyridine nucleotide-disulfide oxidoreductase [Thermovibrio ammonificans HB-1]|uniref:FAD-dependent pyridine nucleotide-disulfide oxidoreductase n=1 Tax=Thermovibrio ammonificans (strain DSM 15698 / JCM 12110 / HB-1) TaxID=648996 RepID=E8T239_THEA1|nr:FAD-dependent oxidoreductase [Thermovibrio ammonificans]ADU96934.1 FAD-dependent pyridine nucleotide-disulfide oxidoreductase [Thermovibrio ammonificans HB-1]